MISLFALAIAALAIASSTAVVRSLVRQHGRERQQLLDRICHLAGKTWTPPPSEKPVLLEREPALVGSPEQYPDSFDLGAVS